jgi:HEAT repeat protein
MLKAVVMFEGIKLRKLAGALRRPGNDQAAYAAVIEVGRIGGSGAVDLLINALERHDGVARSAARELGRLGDERAVPPLVALLAYAEVSQAASEALAKLGSKAVSALSTALCSEDVAVRKLAAVTLGEIGDKSAIDTLVKTLQTDDDYAVRTAAATALGQLKDQRAIWALVGTLKLRDETYPERRAALDQLRQAANLAMRRIGDPLATKTAAAAPTAAGAIEQLEKNIVAELHPRLIGTAAALTEAELVGILKELITASEEISWANLEQRPPVLAPHFSSYEQRRRTAEIIGAELHRRGGSALMKRVLEEQLGGYGAIQNWWSAVEVR